MLLICFSCGSQGVKGYFRAVLSLGLLHEGLVALDQFKNLNFFTCSQITKLLYSKDSQMSSVRLLLFFISPKTVDTGKPPHPFLGSNRREPLEHSWLIQMEWFWTPICPLIGLRAHILIPRVSKTQSPASWAYVCNSKTQSGQVICSQVYYTDFAFS